MKRRELFTAISTFFGGVLSAKSIELMSSSKRNEAGISSGSTSIFHDDGALLTLGVYPVVDKNYAHESILTKIALSDGKVTRTHVPIHTGHYIDNFGSDEFLCIGYKSNTVVKIIGENLKIIKSQNLTEGFYSSGHCVSDEIYVYLPVFSISDYSQPDSKIEVRRKSDLSQVAVFDFDISTGVHDLAINNDRLFILASSNEQEYGDYDYDYDPEKSSLIVMDISDPKKPQIIDIIKTPGNYTFSHIDVNKAGNVIIGTVQRMDKGKPDDSDSRFQKINKELKKMTDETIFPITDREHLKNKFVIPTPFLVYRPKTGELFERFHEDRTKHRRLFTVRTIQNKTYIGCAYSDAVLVIDDDGNISNTLTSSDYGVNIVRGIAPIKDGRKYIAFGDADLGVSIVDTKTYQLVRKYNVRLNVSSHLTYCPSA